MLRKNTQELEASQFTGRPLLLSCEGSSRATLMGSTKGSTSIQSYTSPFGDAVNFTSKLLTGSVSSAVRLFLGKQNRRGSVWLLPV